MKAIVLLSTLLVAATAALAQGSRFTSEELKQPVYKLLQELHQFGSSHNMLNVPPQDGRLLQMLVRMRGAKSVLEVGTSNGVSTIWMALALRETGGKLTTLEIDPEKVKLAGANFRKAGVEDLITIIEGDARQSLAGLKGDYDLVFIDAAKEQYKQYLDTIYPHIPHGGVIVAHNAVRLAESMRDYLDYVLDTEGLNTVILQTGEDGVALTYKK